MNVQVLEAILFSRRAQPSRNFRRGLEGVDDDIGLNSERGQAINSSIGSYVQDDLGPFRHGLPTAEEIFLQKISAEKVKLPLQHFAEIAGHFKSAMLQRRHPACAPA